MDWVLRDFYVEKDGEDGGSSQRALEMHWPGRTGGWD